MLIQINQQLSFNIKTFQKHFNLLKLLNKELESIYFLLKKQEPSFFDFSLNLQQKIKHCQYPETQKRDLVNVQFILCGMKEEKILNLLYQYDQIGMFQFMELIQECKHDFQC
ncbi:unnamed protein product [Paramecium sonneborni]|uniref:Uncharacterized protein n=1 Tax=Paramecium sonneborni TaxID=65129 RepID=A0A8S1M801_9CILI|nr:unnamed protein product [Paramecium sonneborni]